MKRRLQRGRGELSPREKEVLALIGKGRANEDIARDLFISPHTVKNHVSSIYRKLGVDERSQAVLAALRLGLVKLEDHDKIE